MQIFLVKDINEFPLMETKEILEEKPVKDIINEENSDKVFLLIDHNLKKILTFNGPKSSFKNQIYGGILAGMMRKQIGLYYTVDSLNRFSKDDNGLKRILDSRIKAGRAKPIEKKDFLEFGSERKIDPYITLLPNPKLSDAIDHINKIPQPEPEKIRRRFVIIGGNIYAEEEITESFIRENITSTRRVKLGRLNSGFTFFKDQNYSTRIIVKERKIQGIELYVPKEETSNPIQLEIPILPEERFSKSGDIKSIFDAFEIPDDEEFLTEYDKSKLELYGKFQVSDKDKS